jgi:ACS family hexuronate transporter-like MFS transporter
MFISTLYLGALISGIPAGLLSDKWGVPVTISIGLLIQGIFIGLVAFISSFYLMIVMLFVAGLGYGAVNPATSNGIIKWFTAKWRATAMAVKQMGFTAGNMVAAAVLPALAEIVGWRKAIMIVAVSVFACGVINYFCYPAKLKKTYQAGNMPSQPPSIKRYTVAWKDKQIIFWSVISVFFAAVQLSGTVYMAVYLVDRFEYSKVMAGMFLSITQGGGALGRVIWGRISDMYFSDKREKEIIHVGFIAAFTCIIFGILPVNTHLVIMGIVAVIFGFTAIGFNVLFLTLIGEIAGPEKAGQAIGFWVTVAYIGAVITPPLFGMVVDGIGFSMAWVALGSLLMAVMVFTLVYTRKNPF